MTLFTAEDHRPLIRDLSLEVPEGKRLAITGPNLLGKIIQRAAAGLWDEGEGRLILPDPDAIMFVPQQPCAARGRLRDILLEGLNNNIPDERLLANLNDVCLGEVVAREGGLESQKDWGTVLSPGELCTLAFARLLLAGPRFAFLETPGEVLKEPVARRVYEALRRSSITYITVGCPAALISYHDARLELREDGSWRTEVTANAASG
jgi:putative ATP-binding cassette transporter